MESSTHNQDQVDLSNSKCNTQAAVRNQAQNSCSSLGNSELVQHKDSKLSSNTSKDEPKVLSDYDELVVRPRNCELDPQEVDKLFAILFELDSSAFTDILNYEQVTFRPVRRFAPYPVHQQLFMQQQQEQERRRQSLILSPISRVAIMSKKFCDAFYKARFMFSDVFRTRIVGKLIGFIDGYSSRMYSITNDCCEKCVICMYNYQINQELRKLQCNHKFHRKCIDEWLIKSCVCPVCRRDLTGTGKVGKGVAALYHIWKQEKDPDTLLADSGVEDGGQNIGNSSSISHSTTTNCEELAVDDKSQIRKLKNDVSGETSESSEPCVEAGRATTSGNKTRKA